MKLKLILEARHIPDNATVTKPTGTYEYTLIRSFKFYPENKKIESDWQNIEAKDGCVFLVNENKGNNRGSINVYQPSKLLAWEIDADALHDYLHHLENERRILENDRNSH